MKSVISRGLMGGREYFSFSYNGKFYIEYSETLIMSIYRSLP